MDGWMISEDCLLEKGKRGDEDVCYLVFGVRMYTLIVPIHSPNRLPTIISSLSSSIRNVKKTENNQAKKRPGGIEPSTSQSAIECSTTELQPLLLSPSLPRLSVQCHSCTIRAHTYCLFKMLKYFKRTKNWIFGKFLKFVLWFMRNVWNSSFVLTILSFLYKRTHLQKVSMRVFC